MIRFSARNGMVQRSAVDGDVLQQYWINQDMVRSLVEFKYSGVKGIGQVDGIGIKVIKRFDDEVFRIVAEAAEAPNAWVYATQYTRGS